MEYEIVQVARRIRELRDILGFSVREMAETVDCTEEEYLACENGESDFSFTFLYKCAKSLVWTLRSSLPEKCRNSPFTPLPGPVKACQLKDGPSSNISIWGIG